MRARSTGSLPPEATSFVGRERELAHVRRLLSSSRLVTLTGPGGVGKTRLARRAAAAADRAFPSGVWLIELAHLRDRDLLAVEIAAGLGLADSPRAPAESLADHLRDKNLLLVLDNCDHLVEPAATLVSGLLAAAPMLRILATSRQMLGVQGEQIFDVPAFSVPGEDAGDGPRGQPTTEAVELFIDRAVAVVPELPTDAAFRTTVIEICRRLDGLPLAIELAAAQLRAHPVEEILRRVDRMLDVLANGARTTPERHRSLKTAIGWSFDLCSPDERLLWARLSVFAGGFDLPAVEAVCADERLPRETMFDLLASLVEKSVLQKRGESSRFTMLETVREYGLEHLRASGGQEALQRAHTHYFAEEATHGDAGEAAWFRAVAADHANIRLAIQTCLFEIGEPRAAMRIASRLRTYWAAAPSVILEGLRWLRTALDRDAEPSRERMEALWACAYLELLMADTASATVHRDECIQLAHELSASDIEVALSLLPVHESFIAGDVSGALAIADEVIALSSRRERPAVTGEAMFYAASMAFASRSRTARQRADEGLEFTSRHGQLLWGSMTLWIKGLACARDRELDAAADCLTEAFAVFSQLGHRLGMARCLDGLAWLAALDDEHRGAARLLGAADSIWAARAPATIPHVYIQLVVKGTVEKLVRRTLGETRFAREFRDGSTRTPEEVVADLFGKASEPENAPSPARVDPLAILTQRERKVAELVAAGLSNREIAAALVVSVRTTESHVRSILGKLGFHSRAQVASLIGPRGRRAAARSARRPQRMADAPSPAENPPAPGPDTLPLRDPFEPRH